MLVYTEKYKDIIFLAYLNTSSNSIHYTVYMMFINTYLKLQITLQYNFSDKEEMFEGQQTVGRSRIPSTRFLSLGG